MYKVNQQEVHKHKYLKGLFSRAVVQGKSSPGVCSSGSGVIPGNTGH